MSWCIKLDKNLYLLKWYWEYEANIFNLSAEFVGIWKSIKVYIKVVWDHILMKFFFIEMFGLQLLEKMLV